MQTILIDDDDFTRLDIANELGVNQIQRARFAGKHPRIIHATDAERAEAMRITHANKFVLRHDDERERALDATHNAR